MQCPPFACQLLLLRDVNRETPLHFFRDRGARLEMGTVKTLWSKHQHHSEILCDATRSSIKQARCSRRFHLHRGRNSKRTTSSTTYESGIGRLPNWYPVDSWFSGSKNYSSRFEREKANVKTQGQPSSRWKLSFGENWCTVLQLVNRVLDLGLGRYWFQANRGDRYDNESYANKKQQRHDIYLHWASSNNRRAIIQYAHFDMQRKCSLLWLLNWVYLDSCCSWPEKLHDRAGQVFQFFQ